MNNKRDIKNNKIMIICGILIAVTSLLFYFLVIPMIFYINCPSTTTEGMCGMYAVLNSLTYTTPVLLPIFLVGLIMFIVGLARFIKNKKDSR